VPTRADAEAALAELEAPIALLPFVDDIDRSVALALLITAIAFPTLARAPLFGVTATTAGSGKGKLVNVASVIATGQPAAAYSYSGDAIEFEKLLGTILLAGDPIANIDNISRPLQSDKLCQILAEPIVASRILGLSQAPPLPPRTLWCATGNNLQLEGDLIRRSLLCRLDPGCERPELRVFDSIRWQWHARVDLS
jgi:putative DNA primase/helicase